MRRCAFASAAGARRAVRAHCAARFDVHRAALTARGASQEAADEEYVSEAEEADQFDSDFGDSEARGVPRVLR